MPTEESMFLQPEPRQAADFAMSLISVTRLRIRSRWYLPAFFFYTLRATWQARAASGNGAVELLPDAHPK